MYGVQNVIKTMCRRFVIVYKLIKTKWKKGIIHMQLLCTRDSILISSLGHPKIIY